ncbi:hypothetical protein J5Y03_18945 [Bacillus sp. RG28]|uniref:Uncharacterized protein n=1 Tax=Gottfriedia endophytica TaxID=2820819 RepID=A0A940SL93_9BACI|nr:hypothetical protein [Gottfriedia endophytica]MBP0727231.1 hypothetical protein [Gottfriedia endophytica]
MLKSKNIGFHSFLYSVLVIGIAAFVGLGLNVRDEVYMFSPLMALLVTMLLTGEAFSTGHAVTWANSFKNFIKRIIIRFVLTHFTIQNDF